ncbi:MAG: hypothetical protein L0Z62_46375 [Gemmataceae bacterium]|nr:hypothetical protein [Gemmataceae bacterium]
MLAISLILSGILLLIVNYNALRSQEPCFSTIFAALAMGFGPILLTCFLPALALQALLVIGCVIIWGLLRWRPRTLVMLSWAVSVIAYVVVGYAAYQEHERLREQFPYMSMEERLPPRKSQPAPAPLPPATGERLAQQEDLIENQDPPGWSDRERLEFLKQLHEDTVQTFANQQGFGVARMPRLSERMLKSGLRTEPPLPQPAAPSTSVWSAGTLQQPPHMEGATTEKDLFWMHQRSVIDFVNPKGFGFIKDRRHVAGFQEHQFGRQPEPTQGWALRTLDLVGLIVHEVPVAYVSANLPRMDELRKAPTRPLDPFETAGLAALRRGEDLFVRDTTDGRRRVLGAIRSGKQCLSCHGGERGELLGAFSYTLAGGR